ncbi:hypothetical protein RvY_12429-1 [Ramazzottius varieornatus]|uniref:WAP domain-containing protein n=1 Tax=Ramazzottius varieornatus TaxID=947166 RepID=A0A1D1VJH3_RAMVA|nr:hypothetical protein RvY_12429-1 [Ramazzottius varieornatus]
MEKNARLAVVGLALFLMAVQLACANMDGSGSYEKDMYRRHPSKPKYCPNSLINFASCAAVRCASCDERSCSRGQTCCAVKQCCPVCTEALTRRPPTQKPGSCPVLQPGSLGACAISCYNDVDCSGHQKCCYNGCGQLCVDPEYEGSQQGNYQYNYGQLAQ